MDSQLNYQEILALAAHAVHNQDLVTALELCKRVDNDNTPDQALNLIHAAILNQIGMFSASVDIYKTVIFNEPENQLAKFQLGIAYFWRGDFSEAESLWSDLPYFTNFTAALLEAKRKNYTEAAQFLQAFMAENTTYPDLNTDAFNLAQQFQKMISDAQAEPPASAEKTYRPADQASTQNEAASPLSHQEHSKDVPATSLKDVNALLSIYKDD